MIIINKILLQQQSHLLAQLAKHFHLESDDHWSEMQKVADPADISVLFFSAGANFWAILGHFWAILAILGHFLSNLGNFGSFLGYLG